LVSPDQRLGPSVGIASPEAAGWQLELVFPGPGDDAVRALDDFAGIEDDDWNEAFARESLDLSAAGGQVREKGEPVCPGDPRRMAGISQRVIRPLARMRVRAPRARSPRPRNRERSPAHIDPHDGVVLRRALSAGPEREPARPGRHQRPDLSCASTGRRRRRRSGAARTSLGSASLRGCPGGVGSCPWDQLPAVSAERDRGDRHRTPSRAFVLRLRPSRVPSGRGATSVQHREGPAPGRSQAQRSQAPARRRANQLKTTSRAGRPSPGGRPKRDAGSPFGITRLERGEAQACRTGCAHAG
jgi:hypothetical protein